MRVDFSTNIVPLVRYHKFIQMTLMYFYCYNNQGCRYDTSECKNVIPLDTSPLRIHVMIEITCSKFALYV